MTIPNPHQSKPYDSVSKDERGQELYGSRIVDGVEEIVHIPSGKSNMQYHQLEKVLSPEGCEHHFLITDIRLREIECSNCHYATSFHPAMNFFEEEGKAYIYIKHRKYEIH